MKLVLVKSLWGMMGPLETQIPKIAKAGYHAVETPLATIPNRAQLLELLAAHNLGLVAQIFSFGADVTAHVKGFETQLRQAAEARPLFVNAQSARDSMLWEQQVDCFGAMLEAEKAVGVPVAHETHRGRATFTPWSTAALLKQFPELKLTADISHWYCVCESMLGDQKEKVMLAMQRAIHIHGRIGHVEGPQVGDPRAPEAQPYLKSHETFWDAGIDAAKAQGRERLTFTPEFGPPPYMPTLPYTNQPVSDLFDVCLWMAKRFRERFEAKVNVS